jgi:hypothetical protein
MVKDQSVGSFELANAADASFTVLHPPHECGKCRTI